MLCIELPSGARIDFESQEAFAIAMQKMQEGQPIIIKKADGSEEVLWSLED